MKNKNFDPDGDQRAMYGARFNLWLCIEKLSMTAPQIIALARLLDAEPKSPDGQWLRDHGILYSERKAVTHAG